jgi:hypothetical protein
MASIPLAKVLSLYSLNQDIQSPKVTAKNEMKGNKLLVAGAKKEDPRLEQDLSLFCGLICNDRKFKECYRIS